jgi:hypothetical protein
MYPFSRRVAVSRPVAVLYAAVRVFREAGHVMKMVAILWAMRGKAMKK